MAPIKNFHSNKPVLLSETAPTKQTQAPAPKSSTLPEPKDSFTRSSPNTVSQDMSLLERHKRKMNSAKQKKAKAKLPQGGPGTFWDARANSKEMHKIADQQVDKHGAFSPKAVAARAAAVFYDYSIAGAAQECGETFGDPNSSMVDKAKSGASVGLHLLDATPIPGSKIVKGVGNVGSGTLSVNGLSYK